MTTPWYEHPEFLMYKAGCELRIERLEAALREIRDISPIRRLAGAQAIARAALEDQNNGR